MTFMTPLDVVNRALQHCGVRRIATFNDPTAQAQELAFLYDKLRDAEMRRNQWKFATRRIVLRPIDIDTLLWKPPVWASGNAYAVGAVVDYTPAGSNTDFYWVNDTANSGTITPDVATYWHRYFGPVAIDLWLNPQPSPPVSATYSPMVPYQAGEIVVMPAAWSSLTTYPINQVALGSDNNIYVSLAGGNLNNNPVSSSGFWTRYVGRGWGTSQQLYGVTSTDTQLPLVYGAGISYSVSIVSNNLDNPASATGTWLTLGGSTTPLQLVYPIGAGPLWDTRTKNAYRLPYGFLRQANQSPKEGQDPFLGAPAAPFQLDWQFESDYFVTWYRGAAMLRFIADVIDVYDMDPMFCEGLAARIATEVAPSLTKPEKLAITLANVRQHYNSEMREARLANALEIGWDTTPRDEYLSVRY